MKVGDLEEFPFESFSSFRAACEVGTASIGVESQFGMEWFLSTPGLASRLVSYGLMAAPVAIGVYYLIYLFRHNAWLLFGLPLLLIAYFSTHPGTVAIRNLLSPLPSLANLATIAITAFLLWYGQDPGLTHLFLCAVAIGMCNYLLNRRMMKAFIRKTCADEEFLCKVWNHGLANVILADGSMFRYRPPTGDK